MARLSETLSILSWEITERESLEGCLLNEYHRFLLQNDLAIVVNGLLSITYDVTKPLEHIAKHAELTGKRLVLQELLDRDINAREVLKARAAETAQSQQQP